MSNPRIFIDGEHGTTGLEIRERLEQRDDVQLRVCRASNRKDPAAKRGALERRRPGDPVPARRRGARVGGADRQPADARDRRQQRAPHRCGPGYGFPELTPASAPRSRGAKRVSNPGCYRRVSSRCCGRCASAASCRRTSRSRCTRCRVTPVVAQADRDVREARAERVAQRPQAFGAYGLDLVHKHGRRDAARSRGSLGRRCSAPAVGAFRARDARPRPAAGGASVWSHPSMPRSSTTSPASRSSSCDRWTISTPHASARTSSPTRSPARTGSSCSCSPEDESHTAGVAGRAARQPRQGRKRRRRAEPEPHARAAGNGGPGQRTW